MASPIGALRVALSASSAQFEKDMGRARKSVRKSSRSMSQALRDTRRQGEELVATIFSLRGAAAVAAGLGGSSR